MRRLPSDRQQVKALHRRPASHAWHTGPFPAPCWAQNVDAGGRRATPAGESPQANQEVRDENDAYRHSAMVQKIGHAMGMSTETAATTFEVFNFAILALAVLYGLFKFLPKTFRDRNSAIQKHLVDARTAT